MINASRPPTARPAPSTSSSSTANGGSATRAVSTIRGSKAASGAMICVTPSTTSWPDGTSASRRRGRSDAASTTSRAMTDRLVSLAHRRRSVAVPAIAAGAWVVILAADLTGIAGGLHHHALIENGPPLPIATVLFLAGWTVMVAAMMLLPSLPAIDAVGAATERLHGHPRVGERAWFLAGFG